MFQKRLDIKCPRFSDKKITSLWLSIFFPSLQRKIWKEPRFSQFSSYLKRSLPISVFNMQNMKCKVYTTPVLRSAKKNKRKKENGDDFFRHYQQKEQTCWLHVHVQLIVFGWNVNLFCYAASWSYVSKLANKKLKRCPQEW